MKEQYERLHNKFSRQGLGQLTEKYVREDSPKVVIHTLPDYSGNIRIDEETGFVYSESGDTFVGVVGDKAKDIRIINLPDHIKNILEDALSVLNLKHVEEIIAPEGIPAKVIYDYAKSCPTLKK